MTTSVSWSSAASAVATVNSSGLVTGVTEGNSTITASAGGRSGTATVTVNDPSPPQQPSDVVAIPVSNTEMDVTWTDNSNNEDEFRIEREEVVSGAPSSQGASLNTFSQVGTVGANVTTFRDTGLEAGHSYRFRVLACKANGCSATSPVSETGTTWPALVLVTTELTAGVVGTAYSATLEATGGDATYTWSITSGSLPAGLSFETSGGVISGTPTTAGSSTFTVEVTSGGQTAQQALTITVNGTPPEITTTSLPGGTVGTAYSQTVAATG